MKNSILKSIYKIHKLKEDLSAYLFLKKSKNNIKTEKKILIVKTDAIGDYILFRNFLKEIKESKRYKNHKIHLLGNIAWKDIFESLDKKYINKTVFVSLKSIYKGSKYRRQILDQINRDNYDTIIHPVYSRNSIIDILISKIKSKHKISFSGDNENTSYFEKYFLDRIYTKLIKTNEEFEFYRNKSFFEQILDKKINLKNPKINLKSKSKNYFVVNPGASVKFKQWKPEYFAKVIDHLIEKYKSGVYIVGSKSELELDKEVKNLSKNKNKIKIKNGGSLSSVLKLISGSRGVISNETCTPHMTVALGKKSYCISGKLGYKRMHPYPNYKDAIYFYPPNFNNIKEDKRWHKNFDILNSITPESIISKL